MMNAKLKYEKKMKNIPKTNKHKKQPERKHVQGKQSKFVQQYGDRIQSIRNTDANIRKNKMEMQEKAEENTKPRRRNRLKTK